MANSYRVFILKQHDGVVTLRDGLRSARDQRTNRPRRKLPRSKRLHVSGGRGIHFTGPASLPVAMALAHEVAHLFGYVACYDPKLSAYVVAISHDPAFHPGQLLQLPGIDSL